MHRIHRRQLLFLVWPLGFFIFDSAALSSLLLLFSVLLASSAFSQSVLVCILHA
jgi:hypothetical protein